MRLILGLLGICVALSASPAVAQEPRDSFMAPTHWYQHKPLRQHNYAPRRSSRRLSHVHNDFRPHAWCGWWLRKQFGLDDARLNLARNWAHLYGATVPARVGAVVVWRHHVGKIVAYSGGCTATVISGNDGNAVRTRERNICNAIALRG